MANKQIGISYGLLSDSIRQQIEKQGFKYDNKIVSQFERAVEAANTLRFGGWLTDSVFDKIIQRLHKKVVAHVGRMNKLKEVPNGK